MRVQVFTSCLVVLETKVLNLSIMAAKIDPSVIKRTVDTLGKVITKPPLTEKLLSRPPFKYLHDIIIQVISI